MSVAGHSGWRWKEGLKNVFERVLAAVMSTNV